MYGRNRSGGSGRQVCSFFLEGRCRYGDSCKNEHPQDRSQNRYAPLQNPGGGRARSGAFGQAPPASAEETYNVTADNIKVDLTTDRPIWPLTAYGPGRNAPAQLIEGELETSPEEMRVLYYLALSTGNTQQAIAQEAQAAAKANEAVQTILKDVDGAVRYIIEGKDRHPNRLDIKQNATQAQQPPSGFAAPAASAPSPFGQPSTVGQASSAFGQPSAPGQAAPAFGQATAPGFGQSSAFGKPAQPGFGQASTLGGAKPSPFGQPSALGGGGAFGQPSALGGGSAFGQPSQSGQTPAFGQSTFGKPAQPAFGAASTPGFGQASAPGFGQTSTPAPASNVFGAPSQEAKPHPFAAAASQPSAFGAASQQPSGFGQPSAFGAAAREASPFATAGQSQSQAQTANPFASSAAPAPSVFGHPSQPAADRQASPFGQAAGSAAPAFGQASQSAAPAFGQATQPASAFGQATQPASTIFGQSATAQQAAPQASPFAQREPPASQPLATSTVPQLNGASRPIGSTHLARASNGQPQSYKGQAVRHDPRTNNFLYSVPGTNPPQRERLWFPQGAPIQQNSDTVLGDAWYTGDLGKEVQDIYAKVMTSGNFEGDMPEIPPRREWIDWDI